MSDIDKVILKKVNELTKDVGKLRAEVQALRTEITVLKYEPEHEEMEPQCKWVNKPIKVRLKSEDDFDYFALKINKGTDEHTIRGFLEGYVLFNHAEWLVKPRDLKHASDFTSYNNAEFEELFTELPVPPINETRRF